MKKLIPLIVIAFTFFSMGAKAQTMPTDPLRFAIGVETGLPTGSLSNVAKFELGATARLQYDVASDFALTLTSGYYDMRGKHDAATDHSFADRRIIPLKAGIKQFLSANIYLGIEAGAALVTQSGHEKLDLSPTLGWADEHWDVGARYEYFSGQKSSYGLAALGISYGFGL